MEGNGGRAQVKGLDFAMPRAPHDDDTGDRSQRRYLRVYIAICFAIVATAVGFLVAGGSLLAALFPFAGIALGLAVAEGVWLVTGKSASAFGQLVHGGGNLPYSPTYSAEASLVARGDYHGAAAGYRRSAEANPHDITPALRLADLAWRHLRDAAEAERWYLEARRRAGDPGLAANPLIDLYRATGNQGRLMAELARFATIHRGTPAGTAARNELQSLKETLPHPDTRAPE